jgi:hypothetical protein
MARIKRDTPVRDEMSQRAMVKDENRKGKGRKKKGRKKGRR